MAATGPRTTLAPMAPDTTAITIVSISAGAAIAVGGGFLNAHFARRQAERQFVHERGLADRAELRDYLRHTLIALQDAIDFILGLSSDLDALGVVPESAFVDATSTVRLPWKKPPPATLREQLSDALATQSDAISERIEMLREPAVGLALMVGGRHPLAVSYRDLAGRAIACARAVPGAFPPSEEERAEFTRSWTHLTHGQSDFLELAARHVGVKLEDSALSHLVNGVGAGGKLTPLCRLKMHPL